MITVGVRASDRFVFGGRAFTFLGLSSDRPDMKRSVAVIDGDEFKPITCMGSGRRDYILVEGSFEKAPRTVSFREA